MKVVKDFAAVTVGTSNQTQETQQIKALGDLLMWSIYVKYTTVHGTGTYAADAGTPSGAWKGSNPAKFFSRLNFKDKNNTDIFLAQRNDLWIMGYLLSLVDVGELVFNRGSSPEPQTDTADVTNQENEFIIPQSVQFQDLPGTFETEIGVLADYYASVGTGTITLNALAITVRYAPTEQQGFTIRVKAFNVTQFSADTDISTLIPDNLNILKLAYTPDNPNAATAPGNMTNTNVDRISLRRGANEEIENFRRFQLDNLIDKVTKPRITGDLRRPLGMTVLHTTNFVKTASTLFFFRLATGQNLSPRIFYCYT